MDDLIDATIHSKSCAKINSGGKSHHNDFYFNALRDLFEKF
jgi:hypothetical protein